MAGDIEELLSLGFTRVYGGFVEAGDVITALREDLEGRPRKTGAKMPPRRKEERFLHGRDAVLGQWPTGAAARDIEGNACVLADRPSLANLQQSRSARILLQPRSGVRNPNDQHRIFADLDRAGADVLSFQVDSLTRDGRYAEVESVQSGREELNGFPVVNHGIETLRRLSEACPVPLQTRHSARDPRLLAEVSFAGGVTGFEGGAICYNIPYYADLPLRASLERWRYVDRLTARYAELGVVLDREFFGTLTATLIPPCVAITTNLLEALLAVEAGVRSVSLAYAEQGCRAQDIAAIDVMGRMSREFLGEVGDAYVATVFHQYMGAFPTHPEDAEALIQASACTAALAGADRLVVKTPCEATRIPDSNDNAHGLAIAARGVELADYSTWSIEGVKAEAELIEASVRALLSNILQLHPGDTGACIEEAFARGYLDVPFSPSRFNAGRALTARDSSGAVRVLDPGSMPMPTEVIAFETDRMNERLARAGVPRSEAWRLVAGDVLRTTRGRTRWPLDTGLYE